MGDVAAGITGPLKIFMAKHQLADHAKGKYANHKDRGVQLKVLVESPEEVGFPSLQLPDEIVVNVAGRARTLAELSARHGEATQCSCMLVQLLQIWSRSSMQFLNELVSLFVRFAKKNGYFPEWASWEKIVMRLRCKNCKLSYRSCHRNSPNKLNRQT